MSLINFSEFEGKNKKIQSCHLRTLTVTWQISKELGVDAIYHLMFGKSGNQKGENEIRKKNSLLQ